MEIKICGITKPQEAEYLNEAKVDYAGFVFFEKSKRNVSFEQAKGILTKLDAGIQKVAVTVSPTKELVQAIEGLGFDILQVHKELSQEMMEFCHIPIWYAFNIADSKQLEAKRRFLLELPVDLQNKIVGFVVDGAEYGSGKTFDWSAFGEEGYAEAGIRGFDIFKERKFILAGGLNANNVREGMNTFLPDIVDVSSGVEGAFGKDKELITKFVETIREQEGKEYE